MVEFKLADCPRYFLVKLPDCPSSLRFFFFFWRGRSYHVKNSWPMDIFFDIFNRKVYDSNSFIAIIKGF